MTAYLIRRLLFMVPTLLGIMLVSFVVVQFAPGGPVERVIAQLSGSDTGATSRVSGSPGGDFGARGQTPGASGADAMIDHIIAAQSRAALTTACRALDRLIRAGRYWIPHWYKASHWIAYWDIFGRPPTKPRYARGVLETWWHDRAKASKIDHS